MEEKTKTKNEKREKHERDEALRAAAVESMQRGIDQVATPLSLDGTRDQMRTCVSISSRQMRTQIIQRDACASCPCVHSTGATCVRAACRSSSTAGRRQG